MSTTSQTSQLKVNSGNGNNGPTAVADVLTFSTADPSVTSFNIAASTLLANDTGAHKNDKLSIISAQGTENYHVELNPNGSLTVFPTDTLHPSGSFTYTLSDGHGGTSTANVIVQYATPNHAPVAVDDTFIVEGQLIAANLPASMFLANDSDPDGDPLSIFAIGAVDGGEVTLQPNGSVTILAHGAIGGSFEYVITDGHNNYDVGLMVWG